MGARYSYELWECFAHPSEKYVVSHHFGSGHMWGGGGHMGVYEGAFADNKNLGCLTGLGQAGQGRAGPSWAHLDPARPS